MHSVLNVPDMATMCEIMGSVLAASRSNLAFFINGMVALSEGTPRPPSLTSACINELTASCGNLNHWRTPRLTNLSSRRSTPPLVLDSTSLWCNFGRRLTLKKNNLCWGFRGAAVKWLIPLDKISSGVESRSLADIVTPRYLYPWEMGIAGNTPPARDRNGFGSQTHFLALPSTAIRSVLDLSALSLRPQRANAFSNCRQRCWQPIELWQVMTTSSANARWLRS